MKPPFSSLSSAWINLIFVLTSLTAFSSSGGFTVDDNPTKTNPVLKEKIYIHFDKAFYNQGENIWYKIYLVDAINHAPQTLSKVVYVDLISPNQNILESKTIEISEGSGKGDFKLSSALPNGTYTIRAYTNFMRNFDDSYFFTKKILVNHLDSNSNSNVNAAKPIVNFTAEGGNVVGGFLNRIVVKATNPLNHGAIVSGEILDDTNNKILDFETSKFGLDSFQFIPHKGKSYTAIVYHNGEKYAYPLPPVKNFGATMRIDETYHGYRVNVFSSLDNGTNNLELVGLQKGEVVCRAELNTDSPEAAIDLPKTNLMHGVIQFKLLNKNGAVLSEELAFIDATNLNDNVTVTPSKKVYDSNERVELDIDFNKLFQQNLKANMSVSVTEVNPLVDNHVTDLNITSHLLLNSEIKDNIEQFSAYFDNDSLRKKTIHQVLIAQDNNQHLFNEDTKTLKFSPESGFKLSGVVKRKNNSKKPVKANVSLSYKNDKEMGYDQTTTDSLGCFSFNNLNFDDRTFIALKAKSLSSNKYKGAFTIVIDSASKAQFKSKKAIDDENTQVTDSSTKYNRNLEFAPQDGEVKLDQVDIAAEKKRLDRFAKKRKASLYTRPNHTLDFKRLRASPSAHDAIHALQGLFPGVQITRGNINGSSYNVTLRGRNSLTGNNQPLFLLDGLPTEMDMIQSIPIFDIDFIDIVQNTGTSIYGTRGGNGVIAVYTLDGTEAKDEQNAKNGTVSFYHPGYYQAKTFNPNANNSSTLYWNPDLKVSPSENTKITFNATKSGTYKVLLEGITSDGTPLKSEVYFEVN